jgi:hypothetical protein
MDDEDWRREISALLRRAGRALVALVGIVAFTAIAFLIIWIWSLLL